MNGWVDKWWEMNWALTEQRGLNVFGRRCHIHGSRGGKHCLGWTHWCSGETVSKTSLHLEAKYLVDYAKAFFGGCVGVVEKGSILPQSAAHVKGRQGENRQVRVGRELVGTRHRETSQRSQQPLTHGQPLGKGKKWALQTQCLRPCFGGEFHILVGCRKQRLIEWGRLMGALGSWWGRLMSGEGPPWVVRALSGREWRPGSHGASLRLLPARGRSPVLWTARFWLFLCMRPQICCENTEAQRPTVSPYRWENGPRVSKTMSRVPQEGSKWSEPGVTVPGHQGHPLTIFRRLP